jgi:dGTPase
LQGRRLLFETIRRMLSQQVYDVITTTRAALQAQSVITSDDVRRAPPLVQFSPAMRSDTLEVKRWLFKQLYRHPQVTQTTDHAKSMVRTLFNGYLAIPSHMPPAYAQRSNTPRAVADYIAGMTDRFATKEFDRMQ